MMMVFWVEMNDTKTIKTRMQYYACTSMCPPLFMSSYSNTKHTKAEMQNPLLLCLYNVSQPPVNNRGVCQSQGFSFSFSHPV